MFDNIGGQIKNLAAVLLVMGCIAAVILAFMVGSFWIGLVVAAGGIFVSWAGAVCLTGFGELIEETTLNRQINAEILKHLSAGERTENKGETQLRDVPVAFSNERAHQSFVRASAVNGTTERWKCAKCGTMNDHATIMCKDCGTYK